jgi:hypothetical protein
MSGDQPLPAPLHRLKRAVVLRLDHDLRLRHGERVRVRFVGVLGCGWL